MFASAFPVSAMAALPGRVDAEDLVRLAAYGQGLVDAAGPGMAVAMGADGAIGFGATGCDEAGYTWRSIVDARATLDLVVPDSAVRLDIILRPANGLRDLQLAIGGHAYADLPLRRGWQRVSVPIEASDHGERRVRLTLSGATEIFNEPVTVPAEVRALLHGLRFSAHADRPSAALDGPVFGTPDTLWLEAGESISIPTPLAADQALETATIATRGDASDLTVRVETVNAFSAVGLAAELPAVMAMPWNVDLSRSGLRTPPMLRIRVVGTSPGAVGLVRPTLTVAGPRPEPLVVSPRPDRVILVAVRGLRASEVDGDLDGMTRIDGGFSTSPEPRSALASLMTGLYPQGHGVVGLQDRTADNLPTLATLAHAAGWRGVLRQGTIPGPETDALLAGFDDARGSGPKTFAPVAEEVLASLYEELLRPAGQPVFAVALLSDAAAPWEPRGEAWKKHWSASTLPWDPTQGRRALAKYGDGSSLDATQRSFAAALRRGKVDETLEALRVFAGKLAALEGSTALIVVGLGGGQLGREEEFGPNMVAVPLWVMGADLAAAPGGGSFDLTDVAATVLAAAQIPAPEILPGVDLRRRIVTAANAPAFASTATRTHLVADGEYALMLASRATTPSVFQRSDGVFAAIDGVPGQDVITRLLGRMLSGWVGAGASWHESEFSPAVLRGGHPGYGAPCAGPE
ncbi:MAG: hypothetical protein H6744_21535 [Deltaproteobacteria bacterium]|nr:hypothetical protein [Deltaproteobacteria bacterium]